MGVGLVRGVDVEDATGNGNASHDEEQEEHGDADGDGGVTQEDETLGEVDLLGALAVGVLREELADHASEPVADATKVAERDSVATGHLTIGNLAVGRGQHHDEAKDAASRDPQRGTGQTAGATEDDGEHAGHVQGVVTGQEDVRHTGEAREDDVENHAAGHDNGGVGTKVLQRVGDDRLVVGNDALHVEGVVEDLTEGQQRIRLQERRACAKNQEAHDGLDGTLEHVLRRLALKDKAEKGEQADKDCRRRQNVDNKTKYCHDSPFLTRTYLQSLHQLPAVLVMQQGN